MHKSNWQAQQLILSKQWDFFRRAGGDKNGVGDIRQVKFSYTRNTTDPKDPSKSIPQKVELDVPLIAIVKVPNLSIYMAIAPVHSTAFKPWGDMTWVPITR